MKFSRGFSPQSVRFLRTRTGGRGSVSPLLVPGFLRPPFPRHLSTSALQKLSVRKCPARCLEPEPIRSGPWSPTTPFLVSLPRSSLYVPQSSTYSRPHSSRVSVQPQNENISWKIPEINRAYVYNCCCSETRDAILSCPRDVNHPFVQCPALWTLPARQSRISALVSQPPWFPLATGPSAQGGCWQLRGAQGKL